MSHQRLKQRIADLLEGSLGLNVFPISIASVWNSGQPAQFRDNPYLAGLRISVFYASFFCGLPWLLYLVSPVHFPKPSWSLFFLQIYGSFWSGWATATTHIASSSILRIIEDNIVSELSADVAEKIDRDLERRFKIGRLLCVSWTIAFGSAVLAGSLVYHDVSMLLAASKPPIGEVVWWSIGWALLFATSAKVVNVSRFYRVFAAHLEDDPKRLYAMDPARSTLVISVASVAKIMLLFWFGIAISIALVIPFSVKDWESSLSLIDYSRASSFVNSTTNVFFKLDPAYNQFVFIDVLVTGCFSIGFGTVVFLRSEAAIRRAVNKVKHSTLRALEMEVAELSSRLRELDEAGRKRLTDLNSLHKEVSTAGSYRSAIVSGLSVIVPFVIPLVSFFSKR